MTPGQKVTHTTTGQRGIVKRNSFDRKRVFVVFNCGHQWTDYKNYTAESCKKSELALGWPDSFKCSKCLMVSTEAQLIDGACPIC